MYYSSELKREAQRLRRAGKFHVDIASQLGVSKSTAYEWTKNVQLSASKLRLMEKKKKTLQLEKIKNLATINKRRSYDRNKEIERQAKKIVGSLVLDEYQRQVMCSVLFWCEGGKDVRGGVQFINSDPVLIASFLHLLRQSFEIDENKLRGLVHLHKYHDEAEQLKYWSRVTKIPASQFYKSYIKPNTGKNSRVGYPGCISIRYADSSLGKLLQMIYTEFGHKYRGVR